ncbi:WecB/TagA/CpsF family glycosyltransferase [Allopontixanthobacter sediminis]|uniref:WecB/TagA/CpsF family glycosyltransferase n=1 Tax=Allopontixanthobacter sediminis TaxID=1689985 RepID=A0A845B5B9_9SPHN|nr:WecB/TagA/CpsF family glycosyltransferase [Allopontixanthobacter sediminis]MXP44627.1 WecB/TagA/CpsF family glycosyltransferase [Allopontixanthobacter sediminis]
MPTKLPVSHFLGVDFAHSNFEKVAQELDRLSQREAFSYIVTPNVDHILMLNPKAENPSTVAFKNAYEAAEIRLCDSRILQKLAGFHGIKLDVLPGSDLTAYLFQNGFFVGRKIALVGGDKEMVPELLARFPSLEVVQHQPPMGVLQNRDAVKDIIAFIDQERSDFILLAIGAPQSEIIAHECFKAAKSRGVAICIGASIEFLLGRKSRAPKWMQQLRLEWAFRLLSEPRRLWRRYLILGPRIFLVASNWRKDRDDSTAL